jgi:methylmalonyl-CoA/ethylmalonyl-CoA epimerase
MDEVTELRVAMTVEDFDAAIAFYRDAMGLAQLADWSSGDGRVVLLDAGRATLEILDERQAEFVDRVEAGRRVAGKVRLAIEVTDVDGFTARLTDAGGEIMARPALTPWGDRNARIQSPDGMQLTLFEGDQRPDPATRSREEP